MDINPLPLDTQLIAGHLDFQDIPHGYRGGTAGTYLIVMDSQPADTVTVHISLTNGNKVTVSPNPRRNTMGTEKVTIAVGDSQGRQFEELDVTVDTGSTYTAVPRAMLQKLGIPVERSLPSETADGRIVPVDVGEATIRLEGLQFHTPVVFAEENEPSLLGVVSLEQAALAVDPLAGKLIPANLLRL